MFSKLTIDFSEEMQPVLMLKVQSSDDVRDKLTKRFVENLGFTNNMLSMKLLSTDFSNNKTYVIEAVSNPLEFISLELSKLLSKEDFDRVFEVLQTVGYDDTRVIPL